MKIGLECSGDGHVWRDEEDLGDTEDASGTLSFVVPFKPRTATLLVELNDNTDGLGSQVSIDSIRAKPNGDGYDARVRWECFDVDDQDDGEEETQDYVDMLKTSYPQSSISKDLAEMANRIYQHGIDWIPRAQDHDPGLLYGFDLSGTPNTSYWLDQLKSYEYKVVDYAAKALTAGTPPAGGAIGRLAFGESVHSNELRLLDKKDVVNFEVNDWLVASYSDGTSGAARSGSMRIMGIDRELGRLFVADDYNTESGRSASALIPAICPGDYLFREGEFGRGAEKLGPTRISVDDTLTFTVSKSGTGKTLPASSVVIHHDDTNYASVSLSYSKAKPAVASGANCKGCGDYNEYAEPGEYRCFSCRQCGRGA
jgi:hypothetical protein